MGNQKVLILIEFIQLIGAIRNDSDPHIYTNNSSKLSRDSLVCIDIQVAVDGS